MMNCPDARERTAMGRRLILLNGLILAAFVVALAAVSLYGPAQRRSLPGERRVVRVAAPQQALDVWRESGVKGRILVHFARRNNAKDDVPGLTGENYIYRAMRDNVIRALYHVIPDKSWPEVAATLARRPQATREGEGYRLVIEGMPVHVMRLRDVAPQAERVLVNVEGEWWGTRELAAIDGLLTRGTLRADLVTIAGPVPALTGERP